MKLLLIDRPQKNETIKNREIEWFGPWAQPITYPDDIIDKYIVAQMIIMLKEVKHIRIKTNLLYYRACISVI